MKDRTLPPRNCFYKSVDIYTQKYKALGGKSISAGYHWKNQKCLVSFIFIKKVPLFKSVFRILQVTVSEQRDQIIEKFSFARSRGCGSASGTVDLISLQQPERKLQRGGGLPLLPSNK